MYVRQVCPRPPPSSQVLYGSDLDTLKYGSGFPRPELANHSNTASLDKGKSDPSLGHALSAVRRYAAAGWNLNNLCRQEKCILAHSNEDISGMMVPWLYVGMLFSSFCWHVEDHFAHSINYMHWGAPKTWYGVPGAEADAFEAVMRHAVPELMESEAGLLYKMVTMLPPTTIQEGGVSVCHLLQRPGSFVITWPRAYHAVRAQPLRLPVRLFLPGIASRMHTTKPGLEPLPRLTSTGGQSIAWPKLGE